MDRWTLQSAAWNVSFSTDIRTSCIPGISLSFGGISYSSPSPCSNSWWIFKHDPSDFGELVKPEFIFKLP